MCDVTTSTFWLKVVLSALCIGTTPDFKKTNQNWWTYGTNTPLERQNRFSLSWNDCLGNTFHCSFLQVFYLAVRLSLIIQERNIDYLDATKLSVPKRKAGKMFFGDSCHGRFHEPGALDSLILRLESIPLTPEEILTESKYGPIPTRQT